MHIKYTFVLLGAFIFIAGASNLLSASGSPVPSITNSYQAFTSWLPAVFAAILLSFALTSVYYLIGVVLNNQKAKTMAITEFWQAVGTAILVIVIVWVLGVFGATLTSTKSLVVSPTAISNVCTAAPLADSQFQFTSSTYTYPGGQPSPTNIVCSDIVEKAAKSNNINTNLDYGLAAAYVISANMTNQTLGNLNSLYYFEGTSGWLRSLKSLTVFCVGYPTPPSGLASALQCANPLNGNDAFKIMYSYTPFVGYYYQRVSLPPVEITASLIFYLFFLQMTGILVMLYWWPYLLAAGILLRTFSYTRRAGGLVIALVMVVLVIYPIMYLFEYTSLSNGNQLCQYNPSGIVSTLTPTPATTTGPGSCIELIGANSLPDMAINELPLSSPGPAAGSASSMASAIQYNIDFFNFPRVSEVLNYYGCYPDSSNLLAMEMLYSSEYLIPGLGAGTSVVTGGLSGFIGSIVGGEGAAPTHLPILPAIITGGQQQNWNCFTPQNMVAADEAIWHVYGVMAVTGFIVPILNVLIALSAVVGLSGLLGGDTNIIGLGRFV